MQAAPLPLNEADRLRILAELELLDSPPEEAFDAATRTVATALDVPISLVSLIDCERQWFKSRVGLAVTETERGIAFCAHAIVQDPPLIVPDARCDPRFRDNPLVTHDPRICFYAGAALHAPGGHRVGTICAIDTRPRTLSEAQLAVLRDTAAMLSREIAYRHAQIQARMQVQRSEVAVAEGEALFRSVFDLAAVGVAILSRDSRLLRVNGALCDILGYTADELLGRRFQDLAHPDGAHSDAQWLEQALRREPVHHRIERRYVRKNGEVVWIALSLTQQLAADGQPMYFIAIVEDISEHRRQQQRIHVLTADLERQVAERTHQLSDAVSQLERRNEQLRIAGDATMLLTAANTREELASILQQYLPRVFPGIAGELYLGRHGEYGLATHWGRDEAVGPSLLQRADCWALRRGEPHRLSQPGPSLPCPHIAHGDAGHLCVPIPGSEETAGMLHFEWAPGTAEPDALLIGTLVRKLSLTLTNLGLREELRRQALHDPLTGLYNRRYLDEFVRARMAEHHRSGRAFAVLMIDLDHFKALNDRHGHDTGDQALAEVGLLLKRIARSEDAAFRHGGEEFLLIVGCAQLGEALQCAERVRAAVARLQLGGIVEAPALSVSVGVAMYPQHGEGLAGVMQAADEAVYAAKAAGRNCVRHAGLAPPQVVRSTNDR